MSAELHQAVEHLRQVLNTLVSTHAQQAASLLDGMGNVGPDPEHPDLLVQHAVPFVDLASEYTAQWYQDLDPGNGLFPVAEHQVEDKRIDATARWALYAPGSAPPAQRFLAAAQRMIYDGSRDTVIANAERENAIVFRNAPESACRFCRLLTVRPDAYTSPRARMPSHDDDCQCLAVPARPGHKYRHPGYVRAWAAEVSSANTADYRATISKMERNSA